MKPTDTEAYNWSFNRINSKGKAIFRHDVRESLSEVLEYLDSLKDVTYNLKKGGRMLWIEYKDRLYSYYYTTGRWSPYKSDFKKLKKHNHSLNIKDFMERFVFPDNEQRYIK